MQVKLSHSRLSVASSTIASALDRSGLYNKDKAIALYAIPRGGVPAMYKLQTSLINLGYRTRIVENPSDCDLIVDDVLDSGKTYREHLMFKKPFAFLVSKDSSQIQSSEYPVYCGLEAPKEDWIIFPWESSDDSAGTESIEGNITRLLQFIGEDPTREGLVETPKRTAKAWKHWFSGYGKNPADVMKVFEDGGEGTDEMVVVKDIPIYSHCEHHIAAIIGTATIGYIPNGKIIGLSKLSRLADIFARRLQVQERLTDQIAEALMKHLEPLGCGVQIKARHMCMESRGISQQGHHTITQSLHGVFKEQAATRAEFLDLANK